MVGMTVFLLVVSLDEKMVVDLVDKMVICSEYKKVEMMGIWSVDSMEYLKAEKTVSLMVVN